MNAVLLGLGSNVDPRDHLPWALDQLNLLLSSMSCSPVYESEAVGCRGDNYLNLVVAGETSLELAEFSAILKRLEDQQGRVRGPKKGVQQPLDIDILTFADLQGEFSGIVLPRAEITRNAFVLRPLSELVPERIHPATGLTYAALWQDYQSEQKLWRTDFSWRGNVLSTAELCEPLSAAEG